MLLVSLPIGLICRGSIICKIQSDRLSSNQGLLLGIVLDSRLGHVDRLLDVFLRSSREIGVPNRADGLRLGRGRSRGEVEAWGLVALLPLSSC